MPASRLPFVSAPMQLALAALALLGACSGNTEADPLSAVPLAQTLPACVDAPVDVLRDDFGVPHLSGKTLADLSCVQGYLMAGDRMIQLDLARRLASGTLAELVGGLDASVIDSDISYRVHGMRATAQAAWEALQKSSDAEDRRLVTALSRYAAGVNQAIAEFQRGDRQVPAALALFYDPAAIAPWTEVDSLTIARLQSFQLAFDASSEVNRTRVEDAARLVFDGAADANLKARAGLGGDFYGAPPLDPAFILPDATSCGGTAAVAPGVRRERRKDRRGAARDYAGLERSLAVGADRTRRSMIGSNNWIVAPRLSQSGRAMVANDTHLDLSNPPVFYLQHLKATDAADAFEAMGVQFPGVPGIILGMNRSLAWGATVTVADVTDVYDEAVSDCDGTPCVTFKGQKVKLQKRVETFKIGTLGKIRSTKDIVFWDVPHHGPIIPRITADHDVAALGARELSIRYTGYQPTQEVRAVLALNRATSVASAMAAIDRDFRVGGQNWVFADRDGHIGWDTHVDLPRRPAGVDPGKILPGDGSAEWAETGVPANEQPRVVDPSCGFLATANNDPLGVTGGRPATIYHGWDYDPGPRAGRITRRIREAAAAGMKLTIEDLSDIQADHHSFLGSKLRDLVVDAGTALLAERSTPGMAPELSELAKTVDAAAAAQIDGAIGRLKGWQFATPAGVVAEVSEVEVRESIATSIFNVWLTEFVQRTLNDEVALVRQQSGGIGPSTTRRRMLVVAAALTPEKLRVARVNGESPLFDDLTTPRRETRREIAAQSLVAALGADAGGWQWGKLHKLTLEPLLPVASLALPPPDDAQLGGGVPRHGDLYSVDVGDFFPGAPQDLKTAYRYSGGPAIRFVAELGPDGPRAYNVLPGGQVFDPASPHYADQFARWRVNQALPLAFEQADVIAAAQREAKAGQPARLRVVPR